MASDEVNAVDILFDSRNYNFRDLGASPDNPSFVIEPALDNIISVTPLWVNIPFTYYVIDRLNNEFQIMNNALFTGDNPDSLVRAASSLTILRLMPGTYSAESLKSEFKRVCTIGIVQEGINMRMELEPHTQRLNLINTRLGAAQAFGLNFPVAELAAILGFNPGWNYPTFGQIYIDGVQLINANDVPNRMWNIRAPGLVNLLQSPTLNLHCDLPLGEYNRQVPNYDSGSASDILMKIPVTTNFGGYLFQNAVQGSEQRWERNRSIDSVKFRLTIDGRQNYGKGSVDVDSVPQKVQYLPLNGDGFQVMMRFNKDSGSIDPGMMQ